MVQPVAIDYGAACDDVAWVGDESYGANAKRVLARPGTVAGDAPLPRRRSTRRGRRPQGSLAAAVAATRSPQRRSAASAAASDPL